MPQNLVQTVTNTFIKGLITEAGPLTFPKDASIDELNCTLERDGSRRRRMGLAYEAGYDGSDFQVGGVNFVQTYIWNNVGGEPSVSFVVVRVGGYLYFYELGSETVSTERVPNSDSDPTLYQIDLGVYQTAAASGNWEAPFDFCTINGILIVVGNDIDAFRVDRDLTTGAFTETVIDLKERDFEWLGKDASDYTESLTSASVSDSRKYDTKNAGWTKTIGAAARTTYITAKGAWPPLTHPWYSGKDSSGAFSVAEFDEIYAGSSLTANGHYIYNIFDKDRATISGTTGAPSYTVSRRFSTVAEYASRVFYSGLNATKKGLGSRVYFSQLILDDLGDIGKCYQINDPTSEEFSDLLDTDGGFISIPEAYNIKKLHVFGPVLYVFAENGVWAISGVDDVFRATEYSVSKLAETGLKWRQSFVSAEGRPYWWSENGIHTLVLNDQIGTIVEQNISEATIQTYWRAIPHKGYVRGVYDALNKRVMWMLPSTPTSNSQVNTVLLFDEIFTAFYPWSFDFEYADGYEICGAFYYDGSVPDSASSGVKFLFIESEFGGTMTMGQLTDTSFTDLDMFNYDSYAEAGYDFMGDLTTFKNTPYVTSYLNVTEEGFVLNGSGTGYDLIRPSSCTLKAFWDFNTTPSSSQQIYRLKYPVFVNEADLTEFDYPETVVTTRMRVRGRGRSMRLRFESEEAKDFHLLGWETLGAKNPSA